MAKEISNIPSQSTPISQPENTPARTRGRHGAKEVSPTDTTAQLGKKEDSSAKAPEGQKLTSRTITHNNLGMITRLAERGEWSGLSSAIQFHGNTLIKLDQILILLSEQGIKLPLDIQNNIVNHFGKLYALEKIPELTRGLI